MYIFPESVPLRPHCSKLQDSLRTTKVHRISNVYTVFINRLLLVLLDILSVNFAYDIHVPTKISIQTDAAKDLSNSGDDFYRKISGRTRSFGLRIEPLCFSSTQCW